ncbi:MAG: UDP-glucose 4-epimerase GalE [Vicinamibacterales bacterium]
MRVAVTGGAGYIGSVVCEELAAAGHDVLVIDNLSKGHADAVLESAAFVRADLIDRETVTRALREFGAHAVIHLAADSLVGESVADPGKYYRNNLAAGIALLDAMLGASVRRLVFSSTAAVYGEPVKQPIEESDPKQPTNPYGETKLAFEHALRWYAVAHGLSSISLRYFNAAGATGRFGERHSPETHLIPLVLDAAAGRLPCVTIFGDDYPTRDGTCVRDYIHVDDLARAHVLALEPLGRAGVCEAYNLGCGGSGYTVREVIDSAARVTGRPINVTVAARRPGDPAMLVASSSRIRAELGWTPRFQDLDMIISSAWRWLERHAPVQSEAPNAVRAMGEHP